MITTKTELYIVSDLYRELKSFGHPVGCRDMADGICGCEIDMILVKAKKMIETSAIYLGLTQKNTKENKA